MPISQETIQRVKNTARIEEVVERYVSLIKKGSNYVACCPFHDEKTPSFTVSPARGIATCFGGCGTYDAIRFVMKFRQVGYSEAIREIAEIYHIEVREETQNPEAQEYFKDLASMYNVNDLALKFYRENLEKSDEAKTFLASKGFRSDVIAKYQLGYADINDSFAEKFQNVFAEKYLITNPSTRIGTGLLLKKDGHYSDLFKNCIIIPIFNQAGKVVGFRGLSMEEKGGCVDTPNSRLFYREGVSYGIHLAKQAVAKEGRWYIVDTCESVLAMAQVGINSVIATLGSGYINSQLSDIKRFSNKVTLVVNGNIQDIFATYRKINQLLLSGFSVKVLLLPRNETVMSFVLKQNSSEFADFIEKNSKGFIDHLLSYLSINEESDSVKKEKKLNMVCETISCVGDEMDRYDFITTLAQKLNCDREGIKNKVNQFVIIRQDGNESSR